MHTLLHLDIAPETARARFYELLADAGYAKIHSGGRHGLQTSWCAEFTSDDSLKVGRAIRYEVRTAAKEAGVTTLHGVAQAGDSLAVPFELDPPLRTMAQIFAELTAAAQGRR